MSRKQPSNEVESLGLQEVASGQICGHCGVWGPVYGKKGTGGVRCLDCWKRDAGLLPPLPNPARITRKPTIEDVIARLHDQERRIEALEARLARLETGKQ